MKPEQVYRFLLKAYPRRYRKRYADAMQQCFRDQFRATDSSGGKLLLWLRVIADLIYSVPIQHLEEFRRLDLWRDCRRTVFFARYEAAAFGAPEIGVDHLILGILREERKAAEALLGRTRAGELRAAIEARQLRAYRRPIRNDLINLRLCPDLKRAMARAAELADAEKEGRVRPRHLLAATLEQRDLPR